MGIDPRFRRQTCRRCPPPGDSGNHRPTAMSLFPHKCCLTGLFPYNSPALNHGFKGRHEAWRIRSNRAARKGRHGRRVSRYRSGVDVDVLWPKGLKTEEDISSNPGARIINNAEAFPTPDGSSHLFWRKTTLSNLYR